MTDEEISKLSLGDEVECLDRTVVEFMYRRSPSTVMVRKAGATYFYEIDNSALWRPHTSSPWRAAEMPGAAADARPDEKKEIAKEISRLGVYIRKKGEGN